VSSGQNPAGLEEDASTDVAEGPRGAFGSGLQGSLPRMSPGERLLPPEDPGHAAGLRPPALGELGRGDGRRRIGFTNDGRGGWSWEDENPI